MGFFLGLNGIDFFGFVGFFNPTNPKNQSHLIPKKSHLIPIPTAHSLNKPFE
jgi:hypothetical protein